DTFSAILMDVRMPELDGLEAAAAIRSLDREDAKRIPIIALTANAFDEDVQRSLQAGMNAHLTKPVEPEHLYQTLGELIYEAENE
ncbi:MAG: response regulator, partial [Oscillospiraceae bacterium]|nr:response regulator [Oscillospiraceae bacterium]